MFNVFFNINFFNNKVLKIFFKNSKNILYYYNMYIYRFCYKYYDKNRINYLDNIVVSNLNIILKPYEYQYTIQIDLGYLSLYIRNSWITYRHFFGYSKFSKTRNNCNSSKSLSLPFKDFLFKFIFKKLYETYTFKNKYLALHLEFFNKLWFFQWRIIWEIAHDNFLKFSKIRIKKFKFGVYFSNKNKALTFIIKKLKKNKKKITLPNNTFNIGFFFGFSKKLKKQILSGKTIK